MSNLENQTPPAPSAKPISLAQIEAAPIVRSVSKNVAKYLEQGTLHLPDDYSADNAIKQAYGILLAMQTPDRKPVLTTCSPVSIENALMDMVIQGLNPVKKHCYFIVYGNALTCQRSYFGDIMLLKRVRPGWDVYSAIVYAEDAFNFETRLGKMFITKHESSLENMDAEKIKAAYAGLLDENGNDAGCRVMPLARIKQSWEQSKTYKPEGGNTPHAKFAEEMALRTVIRAVCKGPINSSSDSALRDAMRRSEEFSVEAEMEAEMAVKANGDVITIEATDVPQSSDDGSTPEGSTAPPASEDLF